MSYNGRISSFNTLMITIMMSFMAIFAAHAQDNIFIGDLRIAYERGYFDQNTLKGDVSDIRFYAGNDYLGSSERLVLDYDLTGGVFRLNTFLVEGMRMNDEDVVIYLGRMSIEDMVMDDQMLDPMFWDIDGGVSVYRTGDIIINDLDIESLELLEELLMDYPGTIMLVSHDRAFMDNVVSSLLVFENKKINVISDLINFIFNKNFIKFAAQIRY